MNSKAKKLHFGERGGCSQLYKSSIFGTNKKKVDFILCVLCFYTILKIILDPFFPHYIRIGRHNFNVPTYISKTSSEGKESVF